MKGYLKVAEQLLINRVISNTFPLTGKSKAGLGLYALSGLLGLIAFCFFIYAAHLWFVSNYEADLAAALTGLMVFGLAVISGLIGFIAMKLQELKAKRFQKEIQHNIIQAFEIANDEFGEPIKNNPKTAVALATVAGLLVGDKF